jgi:hypothetical protein
MDPIKFELPKIGTVTMKGEGPWRVSGGPHAPIILDKDGRDANPFVKKTARTNSNVTFAKVADAQAVVDRANELLAAQSA